MHPSVYTGTLISKGWYSIENTGFYQAYIDLWLINTVGKFSMAVTKLKIKVCLSENRKW